MSSEHPIDDLFRKELENREPEFREEYWKEAEKMLDRHPQTSSHSSWWKWFGAVVTVATVAGLIGYYFGVNHSSSETMKQNEVMKETISTQDLSNTSQQKNQYEIAIMDSGISTSDSATSSSMQQSSSASGVFDTAGSEIAGNSFSSSSPNILSKNSSTEEKNATGETSHQSIHIANAVKANSSQSENKKNLKATQSNSANNESNTLKEDGNSMKNEKSSENNSLVNENVSQQSEAVKKFYMEPLSFETTKLSFNASTPSKISFTPSLTNSLKKNHSSLKALELSLTGAPTLVTVPTNNSNAVGYEWNVALQYRVNSFVAGAGIGEFFVKDQITFGTDSIQIDSIVSPFITIDSLIVLDSTFVVDSNFIGHWVYDTTLHIISDTTYTYVIVDDTVSLKKTYTSTGHYLELPVMFSYRFYGLGLRWQITAGAAYAWYSGGLRYGINSEGQLVTYKPPPVVSILARLYAQYPLSRKFYLQGYSGVRYVIGLKSDYSSGNYLIYSLGLGLLYTF